MRKFLMSGAATLALAFAGTTTAGAADLGGSVYSPVPAYTPPAAVASWSGFYAGADIGWAGYSHNVDVDPTSGSDYEYDADGSGVQLGVTGGADWQFGNVVAGGLVGVHWSNADASGGAVGPASVASVESNWGLDLLARGGFTPSQNLLIYGLGGYSQESVEVAYDSTNADAYSDDHTLRGWTIGAGVEALVAPNISVKGEYRYTNFAELDFSTGGTTDRVTLDSHRNSVLVGVNYRFGGL